MPKPQQPSRFRLSGDIRPVDYELRLEPDLDAGTFRGEVRIRLELAEPQRSVALHAADLDVDRAALVTANGETRARASLDEGDQIVRVFFPEVIPAGEATVVIAFHGRLGTQLRGLYAATSGGQRYAFTQFEAADARRMMPCFDEPSFKARYRLAVVVSRAGDTVVSNSPIEAEEPLDDGRRLVRFHETPPLSTYLLALAIGPLEASEARMCGPTPIRVWHVPGKGHLTAFALEAAAEALARLERYFAIPYPYGKLDLIAVPDFEAGAMENAGAVTFRETLLLVDPETSSAAERRRSAEVIAHELAHMWYGDLVTMAWWDDLWLNEAFATWMAYKVVDDWKPEWRMWQGYEHDRAGALALDALTTTHPIYARVRSVAEATENFDAITYEKGCAVVRMIEHYLGTDAFREGVRIYMNTHREGNAVAADLWRALEEASGREVARVAQAWIEKAGFPLVSITRVPGSGARLRVRQERFFADPRVAAERRRTSWPVPLVLKVSMGNGATVERRLVEGRSSVVILPGRKAPAWLFGNAEAGGFYRVEHEARDLHALAADLDDTTSAVERLALVGDQWALVRAGRSKIESFLEIVDVLGGETDYDVLGGLVGALAVVDEQIVEPQSDEQRRLQAWIVECFGPAWRTVGWEAAPGESEPDRLRRAALLRIVGSIAESETVLEEAASRLERYLKDRSSLEPNLADTVASLAARGGDEELYEHYRRLVAEGRTPQERRRFLLNLAAFRRPELVDRTLDAIQTPEIPTQDVAFLLMRMFGNPAAREPAWRLLTEQWRKLRERIPPLMISRLVESTPALREVRFARELARFLRQNPVPEAARSLKQALEVFRLNAELRRRTTPGLARWLRTRLGEAQPAPARRPKAAPPRRAAGGRR